MRLRGLRCVEALSTSGATPLSDSSFHAAPVANDDADAAGFMIQCEMCKAWQHGPLYGFRLRERHPARRLLLRAMQTGGPRRAHKVRSISHTRLSIASYPSPLIDFSGKCNDGNNAKAQKSLTTPATPPAIRDRTRPHISSSPRRGVHHE